MAHSPTHPGTADLAATSTGTRTLDVIALVLMIVGGLNWGLVGLFNLDLVAALFGEGTTLARAVYVLVGAAALWGFVTAAHVMRRMR